MYIIYATARLLNANGIISTVFNYLALFAE